MMLSLVESIDFSTKYSLGRITIYGRNFRTNLEVVLIKKHPTTFTSKPPRINESPIKNILKFVLNVQHGIEQSV